MASCFLLFDFSGFLCFVYESRCPNSTGAAFLGACVRVCCEGEGDLSAWCWSYGRSGGDAAQCWRFPAPERPHASGGGASRSRLRAAPLSTPAAELAAPARSTRPSARTPPPAELAAPARTAGGSGARSARGGAPPRWRRSLRNSGRAGKHALILVLILFGFDRHPLTRSQPRGATAADGNSRHGRSWSDWEGDGRGDGLLDVEQLCSGERRWKSWLIGKSKEGIGVY
ncbi:hypothetical protein GQ55_4G033700 [Panicum hallii var. hallii]|uniref:Uncharacterized protein n=1 Tax=Panicum hallii var. hallii TaxID=1504633 RepID=A0A2T7DUU9_9POAL|nr:hypothetical protein GQ55_4G033700 [Panicum hallii var. hallii]